MSQNRRNFLSRLAVLSAGSVVVGGYSVVNNPPPTVPGRVEALPAEPNVAEIDWTVRGYYWERLEATKGHRRGLEFLMDEIRRHGYSEDGQLMTAVKAAWRKAR